MLVSAVALIIVAIFTTYLRKDSVLRDPKSKAVDAVDPIIGNGGDTPNTSGGMIPSTAPPFAMTRWVAQTRENFVSMTPYNVSDTYIHGFQGTHQPAIWMGESGHVVVVPGAGTVRAEFAKRGMSFDRASEVRMPSYYRAEMVAVEGGKIIAEQSATSRVGHLRFTFRDTSTPYVLLEATRKSVVASNTSDLTYPAGAINPSNWTYPAGRILIDSSRREICGSNPERQDFILGPNPAPSFAGHFCARFDRSFLAYGTNQNGSTHAGEAARNGSLLAGYAMFAPDTQVLDVRVGVSFISVDQARHNLDSEVPDGTSLEATARRTRAAWAEKLDRIEVEGGSDELKTVFYTSVFHALQYPYEQSEDGRYYSGYDDSVHNGESYTGYSIWDTYRAAWAFQILLAPERVSGMVQSMLQDYKEGGWLPMWKNIVETNIMVGTHADSLIAEAVVKNITGFDVDLAYAAIYKDATVPPEHDDTISYYDREQGVGYEVRAGLSTVYAQNGWVAADIHSESGSRTLDYAYDDYALAVLADHLGKADDAALFRKRAMGAPFMIFNEETGFMEARFRNGSWAGQEEGWTEGDMWAYSFDVIHAVDDLIRVRGGPQAFVRNLDEHFDKGHNDHANEPSHHIPYLYALAGAASKGQERIREVARENYNTTAAGLSGNEDCGQMSAWFVFSALGFYPVNPVSGEYIVGTPFFDKVTIRLPTAQALLVISAPGATSKPYVKSVTVNGERLERPVLRHDQIVNGGNIVFEMSDKPQPWASETLTLQ
ncbi:glycosyl hydrolase family 92-domain-containing protein [Vararia minispora EC-137]|uniref:Glycosyl hydrolase family 92-domain-containing protein n=1 Tax=Vararia minispora EC-137 TaxID=1314806 RepID=A0ACB8QD32_9AGAM|nr:glycosyl hydrolase family 92-domain-containing protein [Vararia minispora EC-137]